MTLLVAGVATRQVTVDGGGGGDFTTIGEAITFVTAQSPSSSAVWMIDVAPGNYVEAVTLPSWTILRGRQADSVFISQPATTPVTFSNADAYLENITARLTAATGQAAILVNGVIANLGPNVRTSLTRISGVNYALRTTGAGGGINANRSSLGADPTSGEGLRAEGTGSHIVNFCELAGGGDDLHVLDGATVTSRQNFMRTGGITVDAGGTWDTNGDVYVSVANSGTVRTTEGPLQGTRQGTTINSLTLGVGAVTFATSSNVMVITGDGGGNTIATITGGVQGQLLTLLFVDALVTITDDNTHAANSIDISAAFTSADDTVLQMLFDGTSWYEIARSVN